MADRRYDPIELPMNVRRCSECKAFLLDTDVNGHDTWHEALEEALEGEDDNADAEEVPRGPMKLFMWLERRATETEVWIAVAPNLQAALDRLAEKADRPPRGRAREIPWHDDPKTQWVEWVAAVE
jgi:hypothetical protein